MHIRMFLDKHSAKPTTANRCKRVFSTVWNVARGWGFTDLPAPTAGIKGYSLGKREVYITDELYATVRAAASVELLNAMDLTYFTGQRPSDALRMTEHVIDSGYLIVNQGKTKKKLRIIVSGELAELLASIATYKAQFETSHSQLLINKRGAPLTHLVIHNSTATPFRVAF